MLRALILVAVLATACAESPLELDAQRQCLAVPDSAVWQVVDTAAYVNAARRCLAR